MGTEKSHARVLIAYPLSIRQGTARTSHFWSRRQGARATRGPCLTQRQYVDRRLTMSLSTTREPMDLSFATYAKGPSMVKGEEIDAQRDLQDAELNRGLDSPAGLCALTANQTSPWRKTPQSDQNDQESCR